MRLYVTTRRRYYSVERGVGSVRSLAELGRGLVHIRSEIKFLTPERAISKVVLN